MAVSPERRRAMFAAILRFYKAAALIVFNMLLLFALLNVLCWGGLKVLGKATEDTGFRAVPEAVVRDLYRLDERQQARFWKDMGGSRIVFEPFTHFRNGDCSGEYVNIQNGVRHPEAGSWPPNPGDLSVFVFGGSTTFGAGPDENTIPAYLRTALRGSRPGVKVYNFGRVYYYSTQERILFEQLLQAGHVPRIAIFIDGLNDFWHTGMEVPQLERFRQVFENTPRWPTIPVVRALRSLSGADRAVKDSFDPNPDALRKVIDRYLANKRLIESAARAYGVTPVFVWQPVPTYKFDGPGYPFGDKELGRHVCSRLGYPMMAETVARTDLGANFLWLADLQVGVKEPIYVDQVHYSPAFSDGIAQEIAKFLLDRKILP